MCLVDMRVCRPLTVTALHQGVFRWTNFPPLEKVGLQLLSVPPTDVGYPLTAVVSLRPPLGALQVPSIVCPNTALTTAHPQAESWSRCTRARAAPGGREA